MVERIFGDIPGVPVGATFQGSQEPRPVYSGASSVALRQRRDLGFATIINESGLGAPSR